MNYTPLSMSMTGGEVCSFVSGSCIITRRNVHGVDLHPLNRINIMWPSHLCHSSYKSRRRFSVSAKIKKGQKHDYPWPKDIDPNMKSGHLSFLSRFKPLTEKPKVVTLDFEKPLIEFEKSIADVRKMANETGLDFSDQISLLERKYKDALRDLYTRLTPIQRVNIARHPNRPTFLDHVLNITDKWVELHGDRAGYDDPSIVAGLGSIDGKTYMFIGHQKGRNTKENVRRNFGMPTPHGYRKALRMMKYADHHGFPIITCIDTPGAFADIRSEELGQGESIAHNLRTMFGLKVPVIAIVIGEGGSGGALAIACANKLLMLENAVFYVASPEACAAILWKTSQAAPKAAAKLRITATELCKFKVADGIIPEPLGGAHTDPKWTSQQIKIAITKAMKELSEMDTDTLLSHRHLKFRKSGGFREGSYIEPELKHSTLKKDINISEVAATRKLELEKKKNMVLKSTKKSPKLLISSENGKSLKQDVYMETADAFIAMGLHEKLKALKTDLSKSPSDQNLGPSLQNRVDGLVQEFLNNLSVSKSFDGLKQKLKMLADTNLLQDQKKKGETLKRDIDDQLQNQLKEKMEVLRRVRHSLIRGEELDESKLLEVKNAREDLVKILKSANLEVVGVNKKISSSTPPALLDELKKADDVISGEIEKAVEMAGLRGKLNELRSEIGKGSGMDKNKVESLVKEIKEGVHASLDANKLKSLVESTVGLHAPDAVAASADLK